MESLVNIGHIQHGKAPDGWRSSLLSPYGKRISEQDWEDEGWTDADLDFSQQSQARQNAIKMDFEAFFEAFGAPFIVLWMVEPLCVTDATENDYEPLMDPVFRQDNLTCFIDGFLSGTDDRAFVFHLGHECFVSFGHDMSVLIYHKADLPQIEGLKVLKLSEL